MLHFFNAVHDTFSDEDNSEDFVVEKILNKRFVDGEIQYLVKWEGYERKHNSWEPESSFNDRQMVEEFEEDLLKKMSQRRRSKRSLPKDSGENEEAVPKWKVESEINAELKQRLDSSKPDGNCDSSSGKEVSHGFIKGLVPEAIIGAGKINGEPSFLIKWQGDHPTEFIPTRIVYEYTPKLACVFYESKIVWVD